MVVSACSRDLCDDISAPEVGDDLPSDVIEISYSCACADTGAVNGVKIHNTDVSARRAFWLWYLDEAVATVLANWVLKGRSHKPPIQQAPLRPTRRWSGVSPCRDIAGTA